MSDSSHLASLLCAWHFAPSAKAQQRDTVFRYLENCDEASLLALFSTGCLPATKANTPLVPFTIPLLDCVHADRGETLLHRLFTSASTCPAAVERCLRLFHAQGVPVLSRDLLSRTPLHALVLSPWGCALGLHRLVEVLLELGADAEACDAGGTRASGLLVEQVKGLQDRLLKLAPEEEEERPGLAAIQAEQLAAMLLLAPPSKGSSSSSSSSSGQLGSPVQAHPGLFLSRSLAPYAVLLVAAPGEGSGSAPRSEVRVLHLPLVEPKQSLLSALQGCSDPTLGYRAACALGPFMGPHGAPTARAIAAAWRRTALEAAREEQGAAAAAAAPRREMQRCLAQCSTYVALEGSSSSSSSSSGEAAAPAAGGCPYPGECEFHTLAAAFALCKDTAPKRYSGAGGQRWQAWHRRGKEALLQLAESGAGGGAAAATAAAAAAAATAVTLAPILTDLGELLRRHGRRDFPALPVASLESILEEVSTAGLTEELRSAFCGMGSPPRPLQARCGGGAGAGGGEAAASLEGSGAGAAPKRLSFVEGVASPF